MDIKVQVKENDRQRRNGKVWDTVLGVYEGVDWFGRSCWWVVIWFGNQRRF